MCRKTLLSSSFADSLSNVIHKLNRKSFSLNYNYKIKSKATSNTWNFNKYLVRKNIRASVSEERMSISKMYKVNK